MANTKSISLKSKELAKVKLGKFKKNKLDIEIIGDIEEIDGGIELFAKAFKNKKQLGFGKDGSVEIERFRFFNPPILVDDEDGDIIREWEDEETKEIKQRKLKYDPEEAIRQILVQTAETVGKDGKNIVEGKVGNTTSTFYGAAGANSPVDGGVAVSGLNASFSTVRGSAGSSFDNTNVRLKVELSSSATTNQFSELGRAIIGFNTSSIPDKDKISSATLSLYGYSKNSNFSLGMVIDRCVPSSTSSLAASDFNISNWDEEEQATNRITNTNWDESGYNNFTLNTTGKENIIVDGYTWFGMRSDKDFDNNTPSWLNNHIGAIYATSADQTGTSSDPKLVVVHSLASNTGAFFQMF